MRRLLLLLAVALLALAVAPASAQPAPDVEPDPTTGIELHGRSPDAEPPEHWALQHIETDTEVFRTSRAWGVAAVPAGRYTVWVEPAGQGWISYAEVEVLPDEITSVRVDSGIELQMRTPGTEQPGRWSVDDIATESEVVRINGRWGFAVVPPGRYIVWIEPAGQSWTRYAEVEVRPGEVATVAVESGVALAGPTPDADAPRRWYLYDAATEEQVTQVDGRWGVAAVPPGRYFVSLQPHDQSATRYAEVEVREGEVAALIADSGVELVGRDDDADPPRYWYLHDADTEQQVAWVRDRWGSATVPPGRYIVTLDLPGQTDVRMGEVEVRAGEFASFPVNSGVELAGGAALSEPPRYWYLHDADTDQQVTYINGRWGFAAAPPGRYTISVEFPGQAPTRYAHIEVVANEVASLVIDSGVELAGHVPDAEPPRRWSLADPATETEVARISGRWGFAAVPAGRYSLWIEASGQNLMRYGEVEVFPGKVTEAAIASGIELVAPPGMPAPEWSILDSEERSVARFRDWAFMPLPPGRYEVRVADAVHTVIVEPDEVAVLGPGDLGVALLDIELPASRGIRLASGSAELEVSLMRGGVAVESRTIRDGATTTGLQVWSQAGPAILRLQSGELAIDQALEIPSGEVVAIPFDAESLAIANGLSLFGVAIRDAAGLDTAPGRQVAILDGNGRRLLALTEGDETRGPWLAPRQVAIRARLDTLEEWRRNPMPEPGEHLIFDMVPRGSAPDVPLRVDIVIQSPDDGTFVTDERVTLTGRATTTGWGAGATRIAVIIDISGSTRDSAGADLDGDGAQDSILEAEVMAARRLIDELAGVERSKPGSLFEVAVVTFSSGAAVVGQLAALSDPQAVTSLHEALDQVLADGPSGATNFEAAMDVALEELSSDDHFGEKAVVFLSDGLPTEGDMLDGSARAGFAGVSVHSFGIGDAFRGELAAEVRFPPHPRSGPDILAAVAASGGTGGIMRALPNPADIVEVVAELPIFELPEADLERVQVVNATTGTAAHVVDLTPDGFFTAEVPVSLLPLGDLDANLLTATAVAIDGVSEATAEVTVRGEQLGPGWLRVDSAGVTPMDLGIPPPRFQLILDASGSMRDPRELIDGRLRIDVAREVLTQVVDELPEGSEVALRAYGHRVREYTAGDCQDSELLVPFHRLDRAWLKEAVAAVPVRGTTPLTYSLVQAAKDLVDAPGEKLIVLVTDGDEYCGAEPEKAAEILSLLGIGLRVEVVGFGLADEFVKAEMERVATATGGGFHDAQDTESLLDGLRRSIGLPFHAVDETGRRIGGGVVGGDAVELPRGVYTVIVPAGAEQLQLPQVRVAGGALVALELSDAVQASTRLDFGQDALALPREEVWSTLDVLERWVVASQVNRPGSGADPRVHRTQRILTEVGFDPGPADGRWGGRTAAALRAFQEWYPDAELPRTGELDDVTYRALIEARRRELRVAGD